MTNERRKDLDLIIKSCPRTEFALNFYTNAPCIVLKYEYLNFATLSMGMFSVLIL